MDTKIKLLVVDDNPEVTSSIKNYFQLKNGFDVIGTAGDALEAIEILSRKIPDVIIMDLIMPNADGFCLLEKIRNQVSSSHTKVIVLSCLSQESIISRASSLGADFYIIKPFSLDVLYSRVVEVCNKQFTISNRQKNITDSAVLLDKVMGLLSSLGLPENSKGRKYLADCIMLAIDEQDNADNLSRNIYPKAGLLNGTDASNIEKTIRHSIQAVWEKRETPLLGFDAQTKPTNKKLIKSILRQLLP